MPFTEAAQTVGWVANYRLPPSVRTNELEAIYGQGKPTLQVAFTRDTSQTSGSLREPREVHALNGLEHESMGDTSRSCCPSYSELGKYEAFGS